mgnify:CR=1 FL=1
MTWLSTGEVARVLGRSATTVRYHANAGALRVAFRDPDTGIRHFEADDVRRLRSALLLVATSPRACWSCGTDVPQRRRYCTKDGCRKRRQRQRWRAWRRRRKEAP